MMSFPQPQHYHSDGTSRGITTMVSAPGPNMPTPFADSVPEPRLSGYPPPSLGSSSSPYQPTLYPAAPTQPIDHGLMTNNGFLAVASPHAGSSGHSRPSTLCSTMSGTAFASEQSHDIRGSYQQSRGPTNKISATVLGGGASDDSFCSRCCCVIM